MNDSDLEHAVDREIDRTEGLALRDGTILHPSMITTPDEVDALSGADPEEIQDRINSLQKAMQRREEDLTGGDDGSERYAATAGTGPLLDEFWQEVRQDLQDWWGPEWTRRRRLGIERRAEDIKERLTQPPDLPDWLRLIPDGVLTEKQREALVLRFGYELSLAEAAQVAGCGKSPMRSRVAGARHRVEKYWGISDPPGEGRDLILQTALRAAYRLRRWDELLAEWGARQGGP
jgi:hypothetical protein